MYYVLIILLAGIVIAFQFNKNNDLQSKADSLQTQVDTANDEVTRSAAAVQDIAKRDQEALTESQKTVADLRQQMSKIELRPQITLPPPVIIQREAPVAQAAPPPPAPPIDVEAVQNQLAVVQKKIADLNDDIRVQQKDLSREYSTALDSNGNYTQVASHGAASSKLAADNDQMGTLQAQKNNLQSILDHASTAGTAGPGTGTASATNFNPGSMNDVTP